MYLVDVFFGSFEESNLPLSPHDSSSWCTFMYSSHLDQAFLKLQLAMFPNRIRTSLNSCGFSLS